MAAACVTVCVRPPTLMVPTRGLPVGLAATEYVTVPIPDPVAPPVTVIHATLLTAVHEQLVPVTTENAPAVVPVDGTEALVDPRL